MKIGKLEYLPSKKTLYDISRSVTNLSVFAFCSDSFSDNWSRLFTAGLRIEFHVSSILLNTFFFVFQILTLRAKTNCG